MVGWDEGGSDNDVQVLVVSGEYAAKAAATRVHVIILLT